MNKELKVKLLKLGEGMGISLSYEGLEVHSTFQPPVSDDKIRIKTELQELLPKDYLEIFDVANGFTLFNYQDLDGFRFLAINELDDQNDFIKGMYGDDWDEKILVFCIVLGDGDYIAFRLEVGGHYSILDCYHDEIPAKWNVIGTSIEEFLNRLIDEKGRKFCLD